MEAVSRENGKRVKVLREDATLTDERDVKVDAMANGDVEEEPPNAPRDRRTPLLEELQLDVGAQPQGTSLSTQTDGAEKRRSDAQTQVGKRSEDVRLSRTVPMRMKESEYQRQFDWYAAARRSTPVLNAYDIVHRSRSLPLHVRLRKRERESDESTYEVPRHEPRYEPPRYEPRHEPPRYEPRRYEASGHGGERHEASRHDGERREDAAAQSQTVQVQTGLDDEAAQTDANGAQVQAQPERAQDDARSKRDDTSTNMYRTEYERSFVNWQPTISKYADRDRRTLVRCHFILVNMPAFECHFNAVSTK